MRFRANRRSRRGSIMPVIALCLVSICGFVALAVDVGMVAVVKTQCQAAADAAALAGARTLDGTNSANQSAASSNAAAAANANASPSSIIASTQVTAVHGTFHYDTTAQQFSYQTSLQSGEGYNATRATVVRQVNSSFAQVFAAAPATVTASATAAHRPRDVAILIDYSGSMNDESDIWNGLNYLGSGNYTPNDLNPNVPKFGHYSSGGATLVATGSDPRVGSSNTTQSALGLPALANDFYQQSRGASSNPAFSPAPNTYGTTPGGDIPLKSNANTGAAWAMEVEDVNNSSTTKNTNFETKGYDYYTGKPFAGYTHGPGYWGNTFFIWPPDPRATHDWRRLYFNTNDNTKLWDSSGNWQTPSGNYQINYKAILAWIASLNATQSPPPFPPQLRAGRILYYDEIPTDVPASAYNHNNDNSQITDPDQRFWKEYIDYVVGVWRDPNGFVWPLGYTATSIGPDFSWGTVQIKSPPSGGDTRYMDYQDNPTRPRHRLWFGPMTMIQFISDRGIMPGNAHDISTFAAKSGIGAALTDIQNNHPNDWVAMVPYSRPPLANDPPNLGAFGQAQSNLGRDYAGMITGLWFPPNSGTTDVRPFDANGVQTPRASGDFFYDTTTIHGFMLAYNQLSSASNLRGQNAGGFGRKGAQRLVILETDGMANWNSTPAGGFSSSGSNSYYNVTPGQQVNGGSYDQNALLQVVQAICNKSDGTPGSSPGYSSNPGYPGFATSRKPVYVHTIAFGAIFEPPASNSVATGAISLLQQISKIGGTTFPGSASDPTNGYKWVLGTQTDRLAKLRQAFSKVMDDGQAVSLIQ